MFEHVFHLDRRHGLNLLRRILIGVLWLRKHRTGQLHLLNRLAASSFVVVVDTGYLGTTRDYLVHGSLFAPPTGFYLWEKPSTGTVCSIRQAKQ